MNPLLNLLYPHCCWECDTPLPLKDALFCHSCQLLLSPLRQEGRCKTCFQEERPCTFCKKNKSPFKQIGAVFDLFGPAEKITRALQNGKAPYVAKGVAGAILNKFIEEEWKMPDEITYVPTLPSKRLLIGYEPSYLIAAEFGKVLKKEIKRILEVSETKEGQLHYKPSKEAFFPHQTLLLIGDMIDNTRLFQCGEAVLETFAQEVYGLFFAEID